jgi:hypothetical protein
MDGRAWAEGRRFDILVGGPMTDAASGGLLVIT